MLKKLKLLTNRKCNFNITTLIAMAAGLGAASGSGLLAYYWLILPGIMLIFLTRKQLIFSLAAFSICLISGILHTHFEKLAAENIPSRPQRLSGTLTCIDRSAADIPELPPLRTVLCQVETDGAVFEATVIFPDGFRAGYGDRFEFSGIFHPARPAGLICENNEITGELPPLYGERPLLMIRQITPQENSFTFLRPFLRCRDFLLRRLLSNIRSTEAAEMAAKLFFGASRGMDRELKRNFVNTGTIHLFSISGLHVTLFAWILLLLLRPLPFAWRYRIAALLTLFYVLCSGASLPAIRAGAMVIVWCIMRSMLFKSSSWTSMMLTWSFFALLSPGSVGSLSAQYSFGITAALIMLMEFSGEFSENYRKLRAMMPARSPLTSRFSRNHALLKNTLFFFLVPITAFAAGCGMSLYRQNLFVPGSIAANLLLTLFTPILFGAMFFKMLAGPCWIIFDQIGAFILESTFFLLSDITGETAGLFAPLPLATPPLWSVFAYYLCFFGALGLKSVPNRLTALFLAVVIIIFWQIPPTPSYRFIAVSYGSNTPATLILISPDNHTIVIDLPDPDSAAVAGKLLKTQGVLYADVYFSSRTSRASYGISKLNSYLLAIRAYEPDSGRRATDAFLENLTDSGVLFFRMPGSLELSRAQNDEVICRTAGGFEITSQITADGRAIEVKTPDGGSFRQTLPWCSLPVVWQCELK